VGFNAKKEAAQNCAASFTANNLLEKFTKKYSGKKSGH
jgi:hypothetical protein